MPPLWAVHIADGLPLPWVAVGWAVAALLAAVGARRVREEEIPRIALLTAAFFVASSIHVKLGLTSVHLLLNGLVGVILGRRAPLAILIGVTLQALLVAHGGVTTIGVNASVQAIPALACWGLFRLLHATVVGTWGRLAVIAVGAAAWGECLWLGVSALVANPWRDLVRFSPDAGLVVSLGRFEETLQLARHPLSLALLAAFVAACVAVAWRRKTSAEFAIGAIVGMAGVLGTLLLAGGVLVTSGEDWGKFVNIAFLAHLPLALLEAGIMGLTVGFLARVQPELLGVPCRAALGPVSLLLLVLVPSFAWAHRMEAEAKIDLQKRQVEVECWYETGDAPAGATARVTRPGGGVLAEGPVDAKGFFRFGYEVPEALRIDVTAPGGHRAVVRLTAERLGGESGRKETPALTREPAGNRWGDLLAGVGFVLAAGAFWLGWRNARALRRIEARMGR